MSVTVPTTAPVTVPTSELLVDDPITSTLGTTPTSTSGSPTGAPGAQAPDGGAPGPPVTALDVSATSPSGPGPAQPDEGSQRLRAGGGPTASRPADQPGTRLARAAGDATREFAPAEALVMLMVLFLAANGVARRRNELAGVRLDDRGAIVRFE
ncbi:MAG: hypothetical protein ACOYXM_02490 [Actinomycetota bacterium]